MSYQSNQFEIRFATEKDDAELLAILEEGPMPGPIRLIYTRRPSPWLSFHREGQEVGILICRDKKNNCIVSLGVFAIKEMYINKIEKRIKLTQVFTFIQFKIKCTAFRAFFFFVFLFYK